MEKKVLIFSAPSGSGKTTIVSHLLKKFSRLEFSVSATSRNRRGNEINGKDYYFLSANKFREKTEKGEFVEWEEVYPGKYYGTLYSEVERIWKKGKIVVFDVDVAGGLRLKKKFDEKAFSVFVKPPDVITLEERLRKRATDDPDSISERIGKAEKEMGFAKHFDYILVNDVLRDSFSEAEKVVDSFIHS